MADDTTKISTLPLSENLDDDDLLLVVEDGVSKKAEVDYLKTKFTEDLVIPSELSQLTGDSTHRTVTDAEKSTWNGKQNVLTFDDVPTASSNNPVKSDGIYDALSTKASASDLATVNSNVNALESAILENKRVSYNKSSSIWNNGYINTDGTVTSHQWYVHTNSLACVSGTDIIYENIRALKDYPLIACYQNGVYKASSSLISSETAYTSGTFTIPANIDMVIIVAYSAGSSYGFSIMESISIPAENKSSITRIESEIDSIEEKLEELNYSQANTYRYDSVAEEDGGYIKTDGTIASHQYFHVSDFVPIVAGTSATYNLHNINQYSVCLAFYNSEKEFISGIDSSGSSGSVSNVTGTTTVPNTAAYCRYFMRAEYKYDYVSIFQAKSVEDALTDIHNTLISEYKQWDGKKWTAFGTSITDTNNSLAPGSTPTGKYVPYLEDMTGLICQNYGEAGGFISGHILHAIVSYASNYADANIVTMEGSVNDWSAGVPIGEVGDTTPYMCDDSSDPDYIYMQPQIYETLESLGGSKDGSFCGAVYQAIKNMQDAVGNDCRVFVFTDSTGKLYNGTDLRRNKGVTEKVTGNIVYQIDYINALVAVAEYMGVPVIDAGRRSRISEDNADMIVDQIHHTEAGGKHYATTIWNYLKNIVPIDTSSLDS